MSSETCTTGNCSEKKTDFVKAPNFYQDEVGKVDNVTAQKIELILKEFMLEMRKLLVHGDEQLRAISLKRDGCGTCAFNQETDSEAGFVMTAYALARTYYLSYTFACHRGQARWKVEHVIDLNNIRTCAGFITVLIHSKKEAHGLAEKAFLEIQKVLPGYQLPKLKEETEKPETR